MNSSAFERIQASAGSGKTHTLTRRFLALLDDASYAERPFTGREDGQEPAGFSWSEIAAVTFTNKAAAEMRERVLFTLKKRALGKEGTPEQQRRAGEWVDVLLRRYSRLNIRTIDSLFVMLARLSALPLGLSPEFAPAFSLKEDFSPLLEALLDRARHGDAKLRRALITLCRAVLHEHEGTDKDHAGFLPKTSFIDTIWKLLEKQLGDPQALPPCLGRGEAQALGKHAALLGDSVRERAALLDNLLTDARIGMQSNFLGFLKKAHSGDIEGARGSAYWKKESLIDGCVLRQERDKVTEEMEEAFAGLKEACGRAQAIPSLRQGQITNASVLLTRALEADLKQFMREQAVVPLALLTVYADEVLKNPEKASEALCRFGARLHHLLIDEFQDTSRAQWPALEALALESLSKGGGFLYVGDMKQAIYGFRGGDARLFEEVVRLPSLTAIARPETTTLPCNWRSTPVIVLHNNAVFSRLEDSGFVSRLLEELYKAPESDEDAAVRKKSVVALREAFSDCAQRIPKKEVASSGYIRLERIEPVKGEAGEDRIAKLKNQIREPLKRLLSDLLTRRAPGEIAILTRTNDEASAAAELLLEWERNVLTENGLLLSARPILQEVLSLLEFLADPRNEQALYDFLAGPRVFGKASGIEREKLDAWLARVRVCVRQEQKQKDLQKQKRGDQQEQTQENVWLVKEFKHDYPDAWARWIRPFYAHADLTGAYDLIQEIFRRYSLFATHPNDAAFLRSFLEAAARAESEGCVGLGGFLDWWRSRGEEEKLPSPAACDAIRVLTTHKAKGLQFPVVIVPFDPYGSRHGQQGELIRQEVEGVDLLVRSVKALGGPWLERRAKDLQETLNALYVAWTRPQEELYAFWESNGKAKGRLLDVLTECLEWKDNIYEAGSPGGGGKTVSEAAPARAASGEAPAGGKNLLPDGQPEEPSQEIPRPMDWLPRLKIFRSRLDRARFSRRHRGLLAHACLEKIAPLLRQSAPPEAYARLVAACASAYPLPVPERTVGEITRMLLWLAGQTEIRSYLEKGIPEEDLGDERGRSLRADCIAHFPEESVVIEYKTSRGGAQLPHPRHEDQVAYYMRLTAQARKKRVRAFLVYLDQQTIIEVKAPCQANPS